MPVIDVFVARIDIGTSSGTLFSYEPIQSVAQENLRIVKITKIPVTTPEGFVLETTNGASPYGDIEPDRLVFDPVTTAKGASGRVYMRAARLIDRLRHEPHLFWQNGPGVPF